MNPLITLAERCEKATTDNRYDLRRIELDIYAHFERPGKTIRLVEWGCGGDRVFYDYPGDLAKADDWEYCGDWPNFVTSFDAAKEFCERVLPGCMVHLTMSIRGNSAAIDRPPTNSNYPQVRAKGKNIALALCAATLRALDAKEKP